MAVKRYETKKDAEAAAASAQARAAGERTRSERLKRGIVGYGGALLGAKYSQKYLAGLEFFNIPAHNIIGGAAALYDADRGYRVRSTLGVALLEGAKGVGIGQMAVEGFQNQVPLAGLLKLTGSN